METLNVYEKQLYPIVYLDESGFKKDDFRPYAYAPRGQKCFERSNWNRQQTNVIGAQCSGMPFAFTAFECSIDSDVFHSWVNEVLIPELPACSIVVMDNATFHKRSDTIGVIENAGHIVLWLPPYSPDLNPIEKTWAWIKQLRKQWRIADIGLLLFWFLVLITIY
ncbi:IS630 family transposase [Bergeriella denitrificans]|uniref:IS630 family transposase n=1 Tax=Bergeriella denitrificans TaxID=494 RepID=UPI001FEC0DA8|nr:IS630 family transposase [Bergeriella denitrificans]